MSEQHKPPLPTVTLARARNLRASMTDAEQALWFHLRAGRMDGFKFRRQHPVPPYVADFYCAAAKLVVELDGAQHRADVDARRTRFFEAQGLHVLRFWDNAVLKNKAAVLEEILRTVESRTRTPTPLPEGEGLTATGIP
jgi:very-short-patch-repair endonuclease